MRLLYLTRQSYYIKELLSSLAVIINVNKKLIFKYRSLAIKRNRTNHHLVLIVSAVYLSY